MALCCVVQTGCVDAMDFMRAKIEGSQQEATVELVTQMHRDMNLKVSCAITYLLSSQHSSFSTSFQCFDCFGTVTLKASGL